MAELGDLFKQREEEKVVFDTRNKEKEKEEENPYKVAPKEEFSTKTPMVSYEDQREDAAKLGTSAWRFQHDAEKTWEKNMEKGKEKTLRATPFTLEMLETGSKHAKEEYEQAKTPELIAELEAVQFVPRMFAGAHIRKHFEQDLDLIRKYRELKKRMAENKLESDEETRHVRNLTGIFELFEKRVTIFAMENRVTLDGRIIPDEEEPASMSEAEIKKWLEMTNPEKPEEGQGQE